MIFIKSLRSITPIITTKANAKTGKAIAMILALISLTFSIASSTSFFEMLGTADLIRSAVVVITNYSHKFDNYSVSKLTKAKKLMNKPTSLLIYQVQALHLLWQFCHQFRLKKKRDLHNLNDH